jgi:1-phosphatidylinositol-4-phosphate 5-kinase
MDCELLEQEGIMDYSLLLGIHFKNISQDGDILPITPPTPSGNFLILCNMCMCVSVFWKLGKNFLISTSGDSENEGTPHTSTEDTEQNPSDPSR